MVRRGGSAPTYRSRYSQRPHRKRWNQNARSTPVKKFILPVAVGVVVFGAVTAFAASLTVTSDSLGAGNTTVASCNNAATVKYDTALGTNATAPAPITVNKPVVKTATVTTGTGCVGMHYKVTLTGANITSLVEKTGVLVATTAPAPAGATVDADFTSLQVLAADVTGVA